MVLQHSVNRGIATHRTVELCSQLNECAALLRILVTPVNDAAMTCQDSSSCSFQALLFTTLSAWCDIQVTSTQLVCAQLKSTVLLSTHLSAAQHSAAQAAQHTGTVASQHSSRKNTPTWHPGNLQTHLRKQHDMNTRTLALQTSGRVACAVDALLPFLFD